MEMTSSIVDGVISILTGKDGAKIFNTIGCAYSNVPKLFIAILPTPWPFGDIWKEGRTSYYDHLIFTIMLLQPVNLFWQSSAFPTNLRSCRWTSTLGRSAAILCAGHVICAVRVVWLPGGTNCLGRPTNAWLVLRLDGCCIADGLGGSPSHRDRDWGSCEDFGTTWPATSNGVTLVSCCRI